MKYMKFCTPTNLLAVILALIIFEPAAAASQFKTLYTFTGGADGKSPTAGLILDQGGNLYGTTASGGDYGYGTVFKLTPNGDGTWAESVIYSFRGYWGNDGQEPHAPLIFDEMGNLFGTTLRGGNYNVCNNDGGCGTVFELIPAPDGTWSEKILYAFTTGTGELFPFAGLVSDAAGNLYGTASYAFNGLGAVFELVKNNDGSWTEKQLHAFDPGSEGGSPYAALVFDAAGNLYGTNLYGAQCGSVFQLTPNIDGTWSETTLHLFNSSDGAYPMAAVVFDQAGNLYGTTDAGGAFDWGTAFKLSPNGDSTWTESVLHSFKDKDGQLPGASLTFDSEGNLYGTAVDGGAYGYGVVFKGILGPNGRVKGKILHSFANKPGAYPSSNLIFDPAGNLYGTTLGDAVTTFGSVFEITP